ncbi:MAG: hypothetical protein V3U30_03645 [Thermoplasmata archaeon]
MQEKDRRRRPAVTLTLDPGNLAWLRSWASDLPLSRKVDAAITRLREQLGATSEEVH